MIGRDLDKMHSSLFTQAIEAIKTANTKFSIQHDGWTTRNRRAAFLAVHASWIDGNFVRREACIAFNQLGADHTGATFAAHIVSILKENKLWDHWSGVIVSDAAESNIRASRFIQLEVDSEIGSVVPMRHKIVDSLVLCFAHGLNRAVLDGTAAAGAELAMVEKDNDKVLAPTIMIDETEVGGGLRRYTGLAAEQELSVEEKELQQEEEQMRAEMAELMEEPVPDGDGEEGDGEDADALSPDDAEIVQEYEASDVDETSSALTRIHQCLVKIRSSPKLLTQFTELIKSSYPGEKKKVVPMLRNATRWNSALVEMRGCVNVQRAFTALVNSDETGKWGPFSISRPEWLAMEKLVDVLECAEVLSLDAQSREASIGDVLFFHHVLRTNLQLQLDSLKEIREGTAAYGVKKAIIAMQKKARQAHGAHDLLREYLDTFVGRESRAEENTIQTKYDRFIGSQRCAPTSSSSQADEVEKYLSKLYSWGANDLQTTDGAVAWWKRHAMLLPRLSILARVVLSTPASTAVAERGFSHAGIFCSPRRNLGPSSIQKLTMSKLLMLSGFDGYGEPDIVDELPQLTPKSVASEQSEVGNPSTAMATPNSAQEAQRTL
ncbi:unnamed protein product [Tilletia controversa]|nr:unnamed protein product [Tilletia controversa]